MDWQTPEDTVPTAFITEANARSVLGKPPATGAWREGDPAGNRQFASLGAMSLERGGELESIHVAYETFGTLNATASNAVLIVHALTGDSHVSGPAGVGHPPAIRFDRDLLAAEIRPLVAALERHLRLVFAARAANDPVPAPLGATDDSGLTVREAEALELLASGLTAAATARRMGCSLSTANKHFGNVYRKLGVGDRLAAVLEAQRRGILPAVPTGARSASH